MSLEIWSGGQTGVDQAALDFAIEVGIPHGGWVPAGRLSEAGPVPMKYHMKEHRAPTYPPRTEANVRDTDATLIFIMGSIQNESGCLLTASLAMRYKKPYAVINLSDPDEEIAVRTIQALFESHDIKILNVAGARGSRGPDVGKVKRILHRAIPRGL